MWKLILKCYFYSNWKPQFLSVWHPFFEKPERALLGKLIEPDLYVMTMNSGDGEERVLGDSIPFNDMSMIT